MSLRSWVNKVSGRAGREADFQTMGDEIRADVESTPVYQPPEEVNQLQQLYSQSAASLRESGQNVQDISQARAGQASYGGGRYQQALRQGSRAAVSDVTMAGGGNISTQGAITQIGAQGMQSMRDIAVQNQQFRDQAGRDYMQSLQERIGIEQQATGIEMAGLQVGISESDKVYQSELEKARMGQQLEITLAGASLAR